MRRVRNTSLNISAYKKLSMAIFTLLRNYHARDDLCNTHFSRKYLLVQYKYLFFFFTSFRHKCTYHAGTEWLVRLKLFNFQPSKEIKILFSFYYPLALKSLRQTRSDKTNNIKKLIIILNKIVIVISVKNFLYKKSIFSQSQNRLFIVLCAWTWREIASLNILKAISIIIG